MELSDKIALTSVIIAILSFIYSVIVSKKNREIAEQALEHTKISGVDNLLAQWQGVRMIDSNNPITPQAVKAKEVLHLTAMYWKHQVVDHQIIYDSVWLNYKKLYDALKVCEEELPGTSITGKECLTHEMGVAYSEMNKYQRK